MASADKPAVMQVLKDTPEFTPAEVTIAEEVIDSYLRDPKGSGYYVLVAQVGTPVVGYISYGPASLTQGTWDIYWLAVSPKSQGQGIGKSLLATAEEQIKKAKGRMALIETSSTPQYEKTRRFHHSQGYKMVATVEDFYAPGDDKMIFRKVMS